MDKMQWIEKISQFKNNSVIQKVMSKKNIGSDFYFDIDC